jgi:hypothetical protein
MDRPDGQAAGIKPSSNVNDFGVPRASSASTVPNPFTLPYQKRRIQRRQSRLPRDCPESAPISFTLPRCGEPSSPNSYTLPAKVRNATKFIHIAPRVRTRRAPPKWRQAAKFAHYLGKGRPFPWGNSTVGRMWAQSDRFGQRECSKPNPFTFHQFHAL